MVRPFTKNHGFKVLDLYRPTTERILEKIFSYFAEPTLESKSCSSIANSLPIIFVERAQEHPLGVNIFFLAKEIEGVAQYFFSQCSINLIPGICTPIERFFSTKVRVEGFEQNLNLIESYIVFQSNEEFLLFNENFDRFMVEIKHGCEHSGALEKNFERQRGFVESSWRHMERMLPILQKRFALPTSQLQKQIQRFFVEFSDRIEQGLIEEIWKRWFIRFFLLKKQILQDEQTDGKDFKLQVFFLNKDKNLQTYGLCLHFPLAPNESFELKHLKKSLQLIHPSIYLEDASFIRFHNDSIYFAEIKTHLPRAEITRGLKFTLDSCVERYVHQVFMPRNEEDVMRRIVTLCNEISTKEDIPQIAIHFERQFESYMSYLVIIVRPLDATPIERLGMVRKQGIGVHVESCRRFYQKGVEIEASTIRLDIDSKGFIRSDNTIDSLKVRAHITEFLRRIFPQFRDYNGGMISKQIQNLHTFKEKLFDHDEMTIENFYLSLQPLEMQYMSNLEPLIEMFYFYLDAMRSMTGEHMVRKGKEGVLICCSSQLAPSIDSAAKGCIQNKFEWIKSQVVIWGRAFHLFYLYKPQSDTMLRFEEQMNQIFLERIDRGVIT